jgi:hypothetical protein
MSDPHDDRMGRPDGHRYDAPESDEDRRARPGRTSLWGPRGGVMVLIATGTVQVFPH